ncbi:MAG TPA: sulfotransferase domain-containing protein [Vicinamibacterales bacterium]|nr:sulfotransferase domain-containing protein [Vicinamibacterales bacterium]
MKKQAEVTRMNVPGALRAATALDRLQWRVRLNAIKRRGKQRVALASFPRSGNTWLRFMLEAATGELTGNASDREARVLHRAKDGLVIKTHRRDSYRYTHAIHLVRSPFDVADSFFDWKRSLGWTGKHGEESWDEFVRRIIPLWTLHTRHWLDTRTPTFLIRYEDCLREPAPQFRALLAWLDRPVSDETLHAAIDATSFEQLKRKQSAESPVGGKFFRRGAAAKGIERFSPEQRQWVLAQARRELEQSGYERLVNERVS